MAVSPMAGSKFFDVSSSWVGPPGIGPHPRQREEVGQLIVRIELPNEGLESGAQTLDGVASEAGSPLVLDRDDGRQVAVTEL
jgi:hypothetical protein